MLLHNKCTLVQEESDYGTSMGMSTLVLVHLAMKRSSKAKVYSIMMPWRQWLLMD